MVWALAAGLLVAGANATAAEWLSAGTKSRPEGGDVPVRVDRQALREALADGVLPVDLPGVRPYSIRVEKSAEDAKGTLTVIGRVGTGELAQTAVITVGKDAVFAALPTPEGDWLRLSTFQGQVRWVESGGMEPKTTPGSAPPQADFLVPPTPRGGEKKAATGTVNQLSRASELPGGVRIDVLGVYTSDLVALRGGIPAVEAEFDHQFAVTNQAYADSGLAIRFELVGLREVPFAAGMTNHDVLYAVTDNELPGGFNLHGLRDELAADLVAVLRPYGDGHGSCGVAWLNGGGLNPSAPSTTYGYSVSNVEPCDVHVLAHELGHNLGSHHDVETADGTYGAYPYSYGFRQDGPPAFATVMAYNQNSQVRLGQFSRPGGTDCLGVPCGAANDADNVESLDQMAPRISRFRDEPGTISVLDASQLEGSPNSLQPTIRLSSPAPAGGVTFRLSTADGTATAGADYGPVEAVTLTIPEGSREIALAIGIQDDARREDEEFFYVRISNVQGATVFDGEGLAVIVDDDPRLRVTGRVVVAPGVPAPTMPLDILVSQFDGYQRGQFLVTANPPDFSYDVGVASRSDVTLSLYAPPEGLVSQPIVLRNLEEDVQANLTLRKPPRIRGRIVFPDGVELPDVGIHVNAAGLDGEYFGKAVAVFPPDYRFEFESEPGRDVFIDASGIPAPFLPRLEVQLEDVQDDIDLELVAVRGMVLSGQVRFPPGVVPPRHEISVSAHKSNTAALADFVEAYPPDFRYEIPLREPETDVWLHAYAVSPLARFTRKAIGDVSGEVVRDIEVGLAPELRLQSVSVPEGNAGVRQAEVRLVLSAPASETVYANVRTRDGSALAQRDYSPVDQGVSFPPGVLVRTVNVPVISNTQVDGDRIFSVDLYGSLGALPVVSQAMVAIQDDDGGSPSPALAIGDVQVLEGDAGESLARFPLYLSRPAPAGGVRFDLATADGSAQAGSDYVAFPAPGWEIPAGSSNGEFAVRVLGDQNYEPEETFLARISNVSGATLARSEGVATIGLDDAPVPPKPVRDHYVVRAGQLLEVPASRGVLANDIHPRRDQLRATQIVHVPTRGGQLALAQHGGFDYRPTPGYEGEDRFVYYTCHFYRCAFGEAILSVATELSVSDRYLWMLPPASNQSQQGFVRLVNRESRSGQVEVWGIDATGRRSAGTITLTLAPNESRQFNSQDAEWGNAAKGLTGSLGSGTGNWTLVVRSDLDLDPLAYIRTPDGFLTAMHDRVAGDGVDWVVPVFNPAENVNQVSWLRLVNTSLDEVEVEIRGVDDAGQAGDGSVVLSLPPRAARELSAVDLESGSAAKGLTGKLGDGEGKWRLLVAATGRVTVQSLLADPRGYLTNLSTLADDESPRTLWRVTPAANLQQQGFVRITNLENRSGTVTLRGVDDSGEESAGAISFTLAPFASQQLNSQDLEAGNPAKGATGGLGSGQGEWRLQVESALQLEMMGLVRTPDGFLTTLHEQVPGPSLQWRVPMFNPAINQNQVSVLRVVNPNAQAAVVSIHAVDDDGNAASGGSLTLTVPANAAVELDAAELEGGAAGKGLVGALGEGGGKWRLELDAALPLSVMSLLRDPQGYLTNLSSGTEEGATQLDP